MSLKLITIYKDFSSGSTCHHEERRHAAHRDVARHGHAADQ